MKGLHQKGSVRRFTSPNYNYAFDLETGEFARWGKTFEHDPAFAPFPEILDIEITTSCNGPANRLCNFCYKSNNPNGHNMTFEEFKNIIDKMPFLTQCALGADAQGVTNPDMFRMMHYAKNKGITPNLTIADVSPEVAKELSKVAGAVAVSVYKHAGFDVAFNSVKNLSDAGQKQINLHFMVSTRTYSDAFKVVDSVLEDDRLKDINAIVFLGLKQKGRGERHETVTPEEYKTLVDYCLEKGVSFGFDSCSAPSFLDAVKDNPSFEDYKTLTEDCESTLFSAYINERGVFYPCSFTEGEGSWKTGISVLESDKFSEVWFNEKTNKFRRELLGNKDSNGCRNCPVHIVCGKDFRTDSFNDLLTLRRN